jgi:hypothetical protein
MLLVAEALTAEVHLAAVLAVLEWVEVLRMGRKTEEYKHVTNVGDRIISQGTVTRKALNAMLVGNSKDILYNRSISQTNIKSRECPYAAQNPTDPSSGSALPQGPIDQ